MAIILSCTSCSDEVDIYSGNQAGELFIYGILDCSGNRQEIKVRLIDGSDPTGLEAFNPDSLSTIPQDSFSVQIQEWFVNQYALYSFNRVDYPKMPGPFITTENPIYLANFKPFEFPEYKLIIENQNTHELYTAKTLPLVDPNIVEPKTPNVEYIFSDSSKPFKLTYEQVPRGYVYRIEILIHYLEILTSGDTLYQTGSFGLAPHFQDSPPDYKPQTINYGDRITRYLPLDYMLNVFARTVKPDPNVNIRLLHSLDFIVWAGNFELSNYLRLSSTYYDNRRQFFSNINNGFGLFAACSHQQVSGIWPNWGFMYRLHEAEATALLNFAIEIYKGDFKGETE